jgi:hypothetical protein
VSAEFDQPHFYGDSPNPSDYGKTGKLSQYNELSQ